MTILVDSLCTFPRGMVQPAARRCGTRWCHMVSDTSEEELHVFAARIGLRREWYQRYHYDLTSARRQAAVAAGAEQVSGTELVRRAVGIRDHLAKARAAAKEGQ